VTDEEAYRLLELDQGASAQEIRKAYRKLAKVWHPDRLLNDVESKARATERLQAINAAYEHLRRRSTGSSAPPPRPETDHGRTASGQRGAAPRREERSIRSQLIDWCFQPVSLIAWGRQLVSWCLQHPKVATATSCGLVLIAAAAVAGTGVLPLHRSGTTSGVTHPVVAVAQPPEELKQDGADEKRPQAERERQPAERQPVERLAPERQPRATPERARPATVARLPRKKAARYERVEREERARFDARSYATDLRVWGN